MKNLSVKMGLSKVYTDHSCRTTGATILSKYGFNNAQVMSVTEHKSVSSLAQYQRSTPLKCVRVWCNPR